MTPEELEIQKTKIEAETRRYELRMGVWKVGLGTMVVGIAAAFFPFAQEFASAYFAKQTEEMKQKVASNIANREAAVNGTTLNRKFLGSLADEGRSKNLDDRIVLAEYYAYLSDQGEERTRWDTFLKHLYVLREEKRDAVVDAVKAATNEESTATEVAVSRAKADLLIESAAPDKRDLEEQKPKDIQSLLESLNSDDAAVRRKARQALGAKGLPVIRPFMSELSNDTASYRTQLGVLVALTEMMRQNKGSRKQIISLLNKDDLKTLLQFAIDDDRSIRVHAAEFLYDLGDPQLFDLGMALWGPITTDNGLFNLALIFKGLAPHVEKSKKDDIKSKLESLLGEVGPKTDSLLKDAISFL